MHGYYSSRASINLYVLPNGSYTMAFELIWSSDDVDHDTVSLNGISAVETIHDLSNKTFNNYSRLIMQFSKSTDTAPNHLYVDIVIKIKSGKLYPPKLQTYMVCYGVKGLQTDVPSTVYDALWGVDNGVVTFNESIDMGNKKITGVADGTNPNDVINKSQFDIISKYYLYTNELKHNNENRIKFKSGISNYPFVTDTPNSYQNILQIKLSGYYHVIYTDFYKGKGTFQMKYNNYIGLNIPSPLISINLINQNNWIPITINSIFHINKEISGDPATIICIGTNGNLIFKGIGYSSFYIKFLHA